MSNKLIFQFSNKKTDGDHAMSDLLGSKGANLAEMSKIGINVSPGFTFRSVHTWIMIIFVVFVITC